MKYLKIAVVSIGTIILFNLITFAIKLFDINILKIPGLLSEKQLIIASTIRDLIVIAIFFFILILYGKKNIFKTIKINKFFKKKNIKLIIVMTLSGMFLGIILSGIVGEFITSNKFMINNVVNLKNSILGLIFMLIIAPILEEIIFRGILFNYLKKHCNVAFAIIIQAIVFGVFHGNVSQGVNAFVMGIILAIIYLYTNSLWGDILAHGLTNFLCLICGMYSVANGIFIITSIISIVILIKNREKYKNELKRILYK
ncbi:CPBP family intramembrane glutamic endopeptidase [Clostridium thermobutyricum]|uniref:CPBP family intramembrane glutamic endopeptidase n=1 Tax=Clostridium thermobutyricum TaxID=29372 RepID=UPI0018AB9D10|nr:type II CAAX endopeptidase family protein [Clostridium thermobutyricum]